MARLTYINLIIYLLVIHLTKNMVTVFQYKNAVGAAQYDDRYRYQFHNFVTFMEF